MDFIFYALREFNDQDVLYRDSYTKCGYLLNHIH